MKQAVKILAIGDIVGRSGRNVLHSRLQGLIDQHRLDFVIANGENAAGGRSITQAIARDFFFVRRQCHHLWQSHLGQQGHIRPYQRRARASAAGELLPGRSGKRLLSGLVQGDFDLRDKPPGKGAHGAGRLPVPRL